MTEPRRVSGFSLIEVTLAIGVIAFALLAILGLIPIGMRSGRESIDATRTAQIAQDVVNRIRATVVSNNSSSSVYFAPYTAGFATFFFYTAEGARTGDLQKVQYPSDQPAYYSNVTTVGDYYRAKVVISTFDPAVTYPSYDPRGSSSSSAYLLCATLEIAAPVNLSTGAVLGTAKPVSLTFFLRRP